MNLKMRAALATPLLLSVLLVGACSADDAGGGKSAEPAADAGSTAGDASLSEQAPGDAKAAVTDATSGGNARNAVAPISRSVISTGSVSLHSAKLAEARSEVMRLVASWGGVVADEQTTSNDNGRMTTSIMTLRVPTARFDAAMDALAKVGDVEEQSRTSEDVSTQVIDNQARIRAAERSIRSIERLLTRATRLSDIIAIESDLARRQADLDSLKQQEAYLADQTSLSTISVNLSLPEKKDPKKDDAQGFLAGLTNGWSALQGATVVSLTILGAVFPFAVLALIFGVPAWILIRRRRPVAPPPPAEA